MLCSKPQLIPQIPCCPKKVMCTRLLEVRCHIERDLWYYSQRITEVTIGYLHLINSQFIILPREKITS